MKEISNRTGISIYKIKPTLEAMKEVILENIKIGEIITLDNFGTFVFTPKYLPKDRHDSKRWKVRPKFLFTDTIVKEKSFVLYENPKENFVISRGHAATYRIIPKTPKVN
jgi:hypothetical protein